jgi:hypothetical protein
MSPRDVLEAVRDSLGPPPRAFGIWERLTYLNVKTPTWLTRRDALHEQIEKRELLLAEGRVAWAALVQANDHLFRPGPRDHPCMLIYSIDPRVDGRVGWLTDVAHNLFGLKGASPHDRAERRFAEVITDELDRAMGLMVPKTYSQGLPLVSTSAMVFRKHLPGGFLRQSYFPILTHPSTNAVWIVPSRYWPDELTGGA